MTVNLSELKHEFSNPGNAYRMAPLFRINDEIDREELRWQVASLKQQGCGGVFAISEVFEEGAPAKFLSEWWWKVVDWLADACIEQGLDFWVYDDEDWPSGSIGGQLMKDHPERAWKYLHVHEQQYTGPTQVRMNMEDLTPKSPLPQGEGTSQGEGTCGSPFALREKGAGGMRSEVVGALAFQRKGGAILRESIQDLTERTKNGELVWEVPEGEWTLAVYTARPGKGFFIDTYGDLMSHEAMAAFVELVYKGHWDRLKDKPGLTFKGFFTDEPAMSMSLIEWGERFDWFPSMPFTPELPEKFKKMHGYDWFTHLPLLYDSSDPESLRFKCHHWETCCQLYTENYFGQIYRFCEEHGVKSSGHLVVEESFPNHLAQQGGNLPTHFRNMHIPGIDWIHPFENPLPATTPKYATSMAHLKGRERTWCETFAASGWGLTFQEMRSIVNWEHVNGINMQIPICYKYSLRGPKRTKFYNPGLSYQQPYWDHFRGFADYEARLCTLVAGGGHTAQIALAYPSVEMWSHCWDLPLLKGRSDEYNLLGDLLRGAGYDFDILDDQAILKEAQVQRGRLATANEEFEVLLFPRADAVKRATIERALELVRSGGKVLFTGCLPKHSYEDGSNDPQLAELLPELLGKICFSKEETREGYWRKTGEGLAGFAPEVDEAVAFLQGVLPPDPHIPAGMKGLTAYHRVIEDHHLYLLFNNTATKQSGTLTLAVTGHPERWSPETGTVSALTDYTLTQRGTQVTLTFQPYEIIPVMLCPDPSTAPLHQRGSVLKEIPLPGPFAFHVEETQKRPYVSWNFTQEADGWKSMAPPMHIPKEIPIGDWCQYGLATFSGLGHYATDFTLDEIPEDSKVILALGRVAVSAEVIVNGKPAGLSFFEPYEVDISAQVKPGSNHLEVVVANTLSNYYSQFAELAGQPLNSGGDKPERRVSGLIGPVVVRVMK